MGSGLQMALGTAGIFKIYILSPLDLVVSAIVSTTTA